MKRRNIQYGLCFSVLLLIGLVYYFYHPAHYQLFPRCIFKSVTGLNCPGCGAQRAIHELLHLNFKNAFAYNALLVFSIPYVVVGLLFHQTSLKYQFPKTRRFLFGNTAIISVVVLVILFFIYRNL